MKKRETEKLQKKKRSQGRPSERKTKGPRLCCGVGADIKVQRMNRDDRGKDWKPYETTGIEKGREI